MAGAASKDEADDVEDGDWGMDDDDWGDLEDNDDKKKPSLLADNKKQKNNLFLGGIGKESEDLDDVDNFLSGGNEDKFNQVLSKTKEGGGLLASIGLNKDDVNDGQSLGDSAEFDSQNNLDPHKKSDLFDTSKDRRQDGEDDFDLGGFASNEKKDAAGHIQSANSNFEQFEAELAAAGMSEDEGPMSVEQ